MHEHRGHGSLLQQETQTLPVILHGIARVDGFTMAASSRHRVKRVGVPFQVARMLFCATSVGPSTLHSTWPVVILAQMVNRLSGRLVEPHVVKPHLPIPLFLAEHPVVHRL